MRGYSSLVERQASEDAFYGSDDWKQGPREATLADIESTRPSFSSSTNRPFRGLRTAARR